MNEEIKPSPPTNLRARQTEGRDVLIEWDAADVRILDGHTRGRAYGFRFCEEEYTVEILKASE
jgi:hypothetical protein